MLRGQYRAALLRRVTRADATDATDATDAADAVDAADAAAAGHAAVEAPGLHPVGMARRTSR